MKTPIHSLRGYSGRLVAILGLCLHAGLPRTAEAQNYTWGGGNSTWTASNWITSTGTTTFPSGSSAANTAIINSGTVSFANNDSFGTDLTTSSPVIQIGTGATLASNGWFTTMWNLNLNGGTLLANGGANALVGSFDLAGTLSVTGSTASNISLGTGVNNQINIGGSGNGTLTINVADVTSSTAADLTIATVLQNNQRTTPSALIKSGSGTLVLSAINTYTGATTISGGVLALSSAGALATTGTVALTGTAATFDISGASAGRTIGMLTGTAGSAVALGTNSLTIGDATSGTFAGAIGGSGGLTKQGAGALTLSAANTYTGATLVNGGVLSIAATGGITSAGNVNTIGGGLLAISGTVTMAGNKYFAVGSGVASTSGTTTINGGLLSVGTNAFLIGGGRGDATTSRGTGVFAVNSGTVSVGGSGGSSQGGSDATSVWINPYGTVGTSSLLLNGGVFSTARQIRDGGGGSGVVAFNGGTLQAAASIDLLPGSGATSTQFVRTISIHSGGAVIDSGTFSATISNVLATGTGATPGGLTKIGSGTFTLSGANTYTGATTINAGVLSIGGTSGLQGTSGVNIAGGAGLTYTGGAVTFGKNVTVTAGSGTGTISNSGGGLLTLSGTLSKDNSVLRLTGGQFNVTGLITGTTVSASDLVVDAASVMLSNTNTYDGPTFVYNSGTLSLGVNNAIPNTSRVELGNATTRGSLVMGTYTDSISQLVFSGSGGVLSLSGDKTAAPQLATNGSLTLGSNASLMLTSAGTSAGLYRLISSTSLSGSFSPSNVTGVPTGYSLLYTGTGVNLQQNAIFGTLAVMNPAAIITGGSAAFGYTVSNIALSGGATLSVTGTGVSNVAGTSNGSALAGGTSSAISGLFFTGANTGAGQTGTFSVTGAGTTQTGTVAVDVYGHGQLVLASSTIAIGNAHVGYVSPITATLTGSNAAGFRVAVSGSAASAGGISLSSLTNLSSTGTITATLAPGATAGAINQSFNYVYGDGSTASGMSGYQAVTGTAPITVTGGVYNLAAANTVSGTVNFGTVLKGTSLSQTLSIANTAPAGSYSEKLDAAFNSFTGAASGTGAINLLAAGGTSTDLSISLGSGSAGAIAGTAVIDFTSNGLGTSGLGTASLAPQTVSLVASVLDPATALLASGGSAVGNAWTISLGEFNQGSGTSSSLGFGISNLLQTAGYTADLSLTSFSTLTDSGKIFTDLSGTSSFSTLLAGGTNSFSAWMSLATTGSFTNTYSLQFNSSKNGNSLGGTPQNVTLTLTGIIVVPEPGTLALAGIGVTAAAWASRRRQRTAARFAR